MSFQTIEQEVERVQHAVAGIERPDGLGDAVIRLGQDADGDPIVRVLFTVCETGQQGMAWVRQYTPFLQSVRHKLYASMDEVRPVVGLT